MTAPDLQRVITRERIEREAMDRHRELARQVDEGGGRVAIVRHLHQVRAALWPTRMKAAIAGFPPVEALAISWVEFAVATGWLTATGHVETARDGATWQAFALTPKGRRFAAELGRSDLVADLPGELEIPRTHRDELRDLFGPRR